MTFVYVLPISHTSHRQYKVKMRTAKSVNIHVLSPNQLQHKRPLAQKASTSPEMRLNRVPQLTFPVQSSSDELSQPAKRFHPVPRKVLVNTLEQSAGDSTPASRPDEPSLKSSSRTAQPSKS